MCEYMTNTKKIDVMRRKVTAIHFVGIGGIGMSGIAEVLLNLGYIISGSDMNETDITSRLAALGARIFKGHTAANLNRADVVVTSTAVKADNPEVLAAHERGIPVIPRAEMLAELLKMKFSIAISGSHGKTTTTSMISTVLASGGLDPTMVIGGKLGSIGSNAKIGDGEIIVAEADESDGSFLKLNPCIAVITNIDREHLDYYRDIDEIKAAFLKFANIVPFYGSTIVCADDPHVREIMPDITRRLITYGIQTTADYQATDIVFSGSSSTFSVYHLGQPLGTVTMKVPGLFNVYNALATIAAAREIDMDTAVITRGLQDYVGVQRRLEVKGDVNGVTVVDDYGHHPTEIRETLAAARHVWQGRMIVIFQPHRYTRTKALYREFLTAFSQADTLIVTDIYAASEDPIPGVTAMNLCQGIKAQGHPDVLYMPNFDDIAAYLLSKAKPTDVIITQGAGSVYKVGETYLKKAQGV